MIDVLKKLELLYYYFKMCRDLVITSSEKTSAEKYLTILALGMTLQQLSQSNKRKFYVLQYTCL